MSPDTYAWIEGWLDDFSRVLDRDFTAAYRPGKGNADRTTSRRARAGSRRTKRLARGRR